LTSYQQEIVGGWLLFFWGGGTLYSTSAWVVMSHGGLKRDEVVTRQPTNLLPE